MRNIYRGVDNTQHTVVWYALYAFIDRHIWSSYFARHWCLFLAPVFAAAGQILMIVMIKKIFLLPPPWLQVSFSALLRRHGLYAEIAAMGERLWFHRVKAILLERPAITITTFWASLIPHYIFYQWEAVYATRLLMTFYFIYSVLLYCGCSPYGQASQK